MQKTYFFGTYSHFFLNVINKDCSELNKKNSKKWLFPPKKYVFCIFHICQLLPGNRRTDIIEIGNKAVKMAESLTPPQVPAIKKSGKKPDPENPGKIWI